MRSDVEKKLDDMRETLERLTSMVAVQPLHGAPLDEVFMDKTSVAKLLHISVRHLDTMRAKQDFPAPVKLGDQDQSKIRFYTREVLAWLESRRVAK